MQDDGIKFKGEKDGLNLVVNIKLFSSIESLIEALRVKLRKGRRFYKDASIKITVDMRQLETRDLRAIRDFLSTEFMIKDCSFINLEDSNKKVFNGIHEGKTKFVRKTIRSGQRFEYSGNIVIVGDVNSGAEVYAAGNIVVLGSVKGSVYAGINGNNGAIIAAFALTPQIMQIADLITRSPEDMDKPRYPELARIKNGNIVLEPYSINKYI